MYGKKEVGSPVFPERFTNHYDRMVDICWAGKLMDHQQFKLKTVPFGNAALGVSRPSRLYMGHMSHMLVVYTLAAHE